MHGVRQAYAVAQNGQGQPQIMSQILMSNTLCVKNQRSGFWDIVIIKTERNHIRNDFSVLDSQVFDDNFWKFILYAENFTETCTIFMSSDLIKWI